MATSSLLTTREAAERSRLHPITLGNMIRDGRGPAATRLGGRIFISEGNLSAWIDANTDPRPAHAAE